MGGHKLRNKKHCKKRELWRVSALWRKGRRSTVRGSGWGKAHRCVGSFSRVFTTGVWIIDFQARSRNIVQGFSLLCGACQARSGKPPPVTGFSLTDRLMLSLHKYNCKLYHNGILRPQPCRSQQWVCSFHFHNCKKITAENIVVHVVVTCLWNSWLLFNLQYEYKPNSV